MDNQVCDAQKNCGNREFFIKTPLGKLRVWAKTNVDRQDDFPGVYIDLVSEQEDEGDVMLACVEYESVDRVIQTCVYALEDDDPVAIVKQVKEEN